MVSPLDVTALEHFRGLFPFLLVLVMVYAFLIRSDMFKENKGIAALIAVVIGIMTLFSRIAMKTLNLMAPWFVLFIIFAILFILAFMMFGFGQDKIMSFVESGEFGVGMWVMAIMVVIGLGSLATAINEEVGFSSLDASNASGVGAGGSEAGFWKAVFHPKILGMVLIMMVAFFTVRQLSKAS